MKWIFTQHPWIKRSYLIGLNNPYLEFRPAFTLPSRYLECEQAFPLFAITVRWNYFLDLALPMYTRSCSSPVCPRQKTLRVTFLSNTFRRASFDLNSIYYATYEITDIASNLYSNHFFTRERALPLNCLLSL